MSSGLSSRSSAWLMAGATLLLTLGLLLVPAEWAAALGDWGYVGVFVLTLLSSATIVLPSPALGVALLAGKALDPVAVGLVSGLASALGETTGYLAGLAGSTVAAKWKLYPRVAVWLDRWGAGTLFVLAVVPGPMFDLAGIAAGTMRYPFLRYFLVCWLGKTLRYTAIAFAGAALAGAG